MLYRVVEVKRGDCTIGYKVQYSYTAEHIRDSNAMWHTRGRRCYQLMEAVELRKLYQTWALSSWQEDVVMDV